MAGSGGDGVCGAAAEAAAAERSTVTLPPLQRSSADEQYLSAMKKAMLCMLPVLVSTVVVSYMDRSAISYAGSAMITALGITEGQFGLAAGAFYVPYCLLQVPTLLAAKYIKVRLWMATLLLIWGLATVATAFSTTVTQLVCARLVLGAAESGLFPLTFFYMDLFLLNREMAFFWGTYIIGAVQGATVLGGPLAALILATLSDVGGLQGWQWIYVLLGALALLVALVVAVALIDPPAETTVLTRGEKEVLARLKSEVTGLENTDISSHDVLSPGCDWRAYYLGLISMVGNGATIIFIIFLPQIIESLLLSLGLNPDDAYFWSVLLSVFPYLTGIIELTFVSFLLRVAPSTWRYWVGASVVSVTVTLFLTLPATYASGIFLLAFLNLCFVLGTNTCFYSCTDTLPTFYLQDFGGAAGHYAILNSIKNLSSIWTPPLVGYLIPSLGVPATVQLGGLVYMVPALLLFTGWFYIIGRDQPIKLGARKPEDKKERTDSEQKPHV